MAKSVAGRVGDFTSEGVKAQFAIFRWFANHPKTTVALLILVYFKQIMMALLPLLAVVGVVGGLVWFLSWATSPAQA